MTQDIVRVGECSMGACSKNSNENIIKMREASKSGAEAWQMYLNGIKCLLEKVNDAYYLKEVREELAEDIWKAYRDALPTWPSIGEYSSICTRSFNQTKLVNYNDCVYLIQMQGVINMQDYRVSQKEFQARIWAPYGDPLIIRGLKFDKNRLKKMASLGRQNTITMIKACEADCMGELMDKFDRLFR